MVVCSVAPLQRDALLGFVHHSHPTWGARRTLRERKKTGNDLDLARRGGAVLHSALSAKACLTHMKNSRPELWQLLFSGSALTGSRA